MTKVNKKGLSFNLRMRACINAVKIGIKEKYLYKVSALTYSTLLAVIPLISVSIYLVSLMPFFDVLIGDLRSYALANFVPAMSQSVQEYMEEFADQAASLPVGGIIFLFVTVGMLMELVKRTMNDIWHSSEHGTWVTVVISWIVLLSMPLLVGISIFSSYYFLSLSWVDYTIHHLGLTFVLSTLMPIFINTIAFGLLYYFAPNCYVRVSDSLFGALTAAVLFEIAKTIFAYYTQNFANYDYIYGSLAIIPIFMVWIYISWSIIIYGAIVTYAQNQQRII